MNELLVKGSDCLILFDVNSGTMKGDGIRLSNCGLMNNGEGSGFVYRNVVN